MKTLPRTQFGNPVLRQKAKKVSAGFLKSAEFKKLVPQMFYTIRNIGVGLAAPQIGKSLSFAVIRVKPNKLRPNLEPVPKTVIINPKIIWRSKRQVDDWEGCLSCRVLRGKVLRASKVRVEYTDEKGKKVIRDVSGFLARIFQHEIDHLNGMLYVDRMRDMTTLMTLPEFKKRILK